MRQGAIALDLATLAIAGCGGGDDSSTTTGPSQPDGASLKAPFDTLAAKAYDEAGKDRDTDYTSGVTLKSGCPLADDDAASAIADAAGLDELVFRDDTFVQGLPSQQETMICSVEAPPGAEHPTILNVSAGTTTLTRDQTLDRVLQLEAVKRHEIEGSAEGLDPASVVAVGDDALSQFLWVDGDFQIAVGGATDQLTPDQGFAALSAAVDGVSRTLSGS